MKLLAVGGLGATFRGAFQAPSHFCLPFFLVWVSSQPKVALDLYWHCPVFPLPLVFAVFSVVFDVSFIAAVATLLVVGLVPVCVPILWFAIVCVVFGVCCLLLLLLFSCCCSCFSNFCCCCLC